MGPDEFHALLQQQIPLSDAWPLLAFIALVGWLGLKIPNGRKWYSPLVGLLQITGLGIALIVVVVVWLQLIVK